jgi:hypothetical protein
MKWILYIVAVQVVLLFVDMHFTWAFSQTSTDDGTSHEQHYRKVGLMGGAIQYGFADYSTDRGLAACFCKPVSGRLLPGRAFWVDFYAIWLPLWIPAVSILGLWKAVVITKKKNSQHAVAD